MEADLGWFEPTLGRGELLFEYWEITKAQMIKIPEPFQEREEAISDYEMFGDCVASYDCEVCGDGFMLPGFHGIYELKCNCGQEYFLIMNYYAGVLYRKEEIVEFLKDHELDLPDYDNKAFREDVLSGRSLRCGKMKF